MSFTDFINGQNILFCDETLWPGGRKTVGDFTGGRHIRAGILGREQIGYYGRNVSNEYPLEEGDILVVCGKYDFPYTLSAAVVESSRLRRLTQQEWMAEGKRIDALTLMW